ncbi:hypothetical protein O6H91_13G016600 [Diphasiastrum complanatum]|uniref:Uncharacterized protein n=1 Tax=Diphasiastrum complanatum TaxID=34168 RepID=A0ACC2BSG5_DIPCM|nr:hypothetical protein O6H91_13G016600 [Diphasiastrum complanatum]
MVAKGGSRLAAHFWNEEIESSRSLDAVVRTVPNEPPPLPILRTSKLSRAQQLLLLQRLVGLPCMPSYAPDLDSSAGLVLDRVLASTGGNAWWATLTGRIRAQRLFSQQKEPDRAANVSSNSVRGWSQAKRLLDMSLYALCMRVRMILGPKTSLNLSAEMDSLQGLSYHSKISSYRGQATLRHKLRRHHVIAEAAWNQLSVDRETNYWILPIACSFDIESSQKNSLIQYRVGMYHSSGVLLGYDGQEVKRAPAGALPGTHARAAVLLGKNFDVWKAQSGQPNRKLRKPYNLLAARPHVTISSFLGGIVNTRLNPRHLDFNKNAAESSASSGSLQIQSYNYSPVSADLFASLGFTAQVGLFQRSFLDRTKFGARIGFGAASSVAAATMKSVISAEASLEEKQEHQCPTLDISVEQQILGPLQARLDARFSLRAITQRAWPDMHDITYGLDCSLESFGAAKLVVWYSPSRNEGMAEIRLLET